MDIISLLDSRHLKPIEKRADIAQAIKMGTFTIKDILSLKDAVDDKKMALIFEAMEEITTKDPQAADVDWLTFAQEFISSKSDNLKREASRIVGNIAHLFPNDLETAIQKLLDNTSDGGTVVRWSSAYALGRIVSIDRYARGELCDAVSQLSEKEENNGVKNQYLNGLKIAGKMRQ